MPRMCRRAHAPCMMLLWLEKNGHTHAVLDRTIEMALLRLL